MVKVTVYLDETIWRLFRILCLRQGTSASKEIERLLRLAIQSSSETSQESDHD